MTLTYREMVKRIFLTLKHPVRILMLPTDWLQHAFRWATKIGLVRETAFGASIFQRMNQDLVFEVSEGLSLLNYDPRSFQPDFKGYEEY